MSDHDPKCHAYGYGPGQRMDICICMGIRIGRDDERKRLREQVEALDTILHDDPSSRSGALVEWVRRGVVLELLGGDDD